MTRVRDQLGLGGAPAPPEPPGEESAVEVPPYDPMGGAVAGLLAAVEVMATAQDAVLHAVQQLQLCWASQSRTNTRIGELMGKLADMEETNRAMESDLNRAASEIAASRSGGTRPAPSPIAGKVPAVSEPDCDHPAGAIAEIPTMGSSSQFMCQACGTAVVPVEDDSDSEPEWVTITPGMLAEAEGGE